MHKLPIRFSLILLAFLVVSEFAYAQLYTKDFEGINPYLNVDTNTTNLGGVGAGGDNFWLINSDYSGGTIGPIIIPSTPSQPAGIGSPNGNYLHITSRVGAGLATPITNAHWDSIGSHGQVYITEINTGLSTTGLIGVTMQFWFLNGSPSSTAQVYVKDGATGTWTPLNGTDFTPQLGNVTNTWTQTTYSGNLLDNKGQIYLAFKYAADTVSGQQPSLAIDDIKIYGPPPVVAAVSSPNPIPDTVCLGTQINFVADNSIGNLVGYQWNFNGANNGPQTLTGQSVIFEAGATGNFTFQLIVTDGVTLDTLDIPMYIDPCTPPTINISGSPTTVCEGNTVNFVDATTAGSAPIQSRSWVFPGGTPFTSTSLTPTVTYSTVGLFDVYYSVTDKNGTYFDTLYDYINVVSCPLPIAEFTVSKRQICPGDCINFFDQSQNVFVGQSTWSWQFPGSDSATSTQQNPQHICYQIPGKYDVTLTVTNPNGTDTETKLAYIVVDSCLPPIARYSVEDDKICQGTCVQFFNTSMREDSVNWFFAGADLPYQTSTESNPIVCYSDTGLFNVQMVVTNPYGADILLDVDRISVKPFPKVQAPQDTSVLIGNSVELEAFGTANGFRWSPDYEVDCEFCRVTNVSPKVNTTYYVTNINENGCESTDSVVVIVVEHYYRGVPDAFSPNGDGENDQLKVLGNGIAQLEFYVYDRFGKLLFETRDQNDGWDGTYKGQEMPQGVYIYFAKITYISGYQEILKGDVTLVR